MDGENQGAEFDIDCDDDDAVGVLLRCLGSGIRHVIFWLSRAIREDLTTIFERIQRF